MNKNTSIALKDIKLEWDFSKIYKSDNDPQIEKDIDLIIDLYSDFAKKIFQ